jgi:ubiquinone/menaquinone biosynthesis C-methylase UbiE
MWWMLRKTTHREPLPITMSGVRAGERVLQIDAGDPAIVAGIAAKVGLAGEAAIVVADDDLGARVRDAAADAGAHVEVTVASLDRLPAADAAFDLVVVHAAQVPPATLAEPARSAMLGEAYRVVRPGGRIIVIGRGTVTGLSALLRGAPPESGDGRGIVTALETAGFRPVRELADRGGHRFVEGIRPR